MNIASLLEAVILGSVQGITEFLPVSSTAHLFLFQSMFGLDQETYGLSFDMFTNLGTTLALIWFFRTDLAALIKRLRIPTKNLPLSPSEKVPWWILSSTVIVGVVGYFLEDTIDSTFRTLPLIATMLILFGIVMLLAERYAKTHERRELSTPSAFAVGLSQMLAFVPGVSRSGATISTGMFMGLSREDAARFSFLLSVPITLAAIIKRLATAADTFAANPPGAEVASFYIVGLLSAGIVGYYSIKFLLDFVRRSSLAAFAYYRFALAGVIIVWISLT